MYCAKDKEVYFDQYCKSCKHFEKDEEEEPCSECLGDTVNEHSHKPTRWAAGEETKRRV